MIPNKYDLIVIGAGASGLIASIVAAQNNYKVLLLEKLPKIGQKLKASGGGRCNITNTLSNDIFMEHFGKNGRFMQDALNLFNSSKLIEFFKNIGVDTHAPDGFRVFPSSHKSTTIISALLNKLIQLNVTIKCSQKVEHLLHKNNKILGVQTQNNKFYANNVIISTGGLGYPTLGSNGDGYNLAKQINHTITSLHPAMMPLYTKESWVKQCRADTIPKVSMKIDLKKAKKFKAKGDLIFTSKGIRGPVVLDFARYIIPFLELTNNEVPILINLTNDKNEEQIAKHINQQVQNNPHNTTLQHLESLLPKSVALQLCKIINIDENLTYKHIDGKLKTKLIKILTWTPLTVVGHDGFKNAMITRGGIDLKQINPKTMQSTICSGLYFCGEVVNLDGPCGGYNLQWAFASGYLAGHLLDQNYK